MKTERLKKTTEFACVDEKQPRATLHSCMLNERCAYDPSHMHLQQRFALHVAQYHRAREELET